MECAPRAARWCQQEPAIRAEDIRDFAAAAWTVTRSDEPQAVRKTVGHASNGTKRRAGHQPGQHRPAAMKGKRRLRK